MKHLLPSIVLATVVAFAYVGTADAQTTINGMPPKDFYAQLIHKPNDPAKPDQWCRTPLGDDTKIPGTDRWFDVDVYMFKDGKYVAHYKEFKKGGSVGGGTALEDMKETYIQGTWSVRGIELVLSGLGTGRGLKFNGGPALDLKMTTAPFNPAVKGQTIRLKYLGTSFGTYGLRYQMKRLGITPKF